MPTPTYVPVIPTGRDVSFSGAIEFTSSVEVNGVLSIAEGANARMGTATLVNGLVVVANTSVTANTRIFMTVQVPAGSVGTPRVASRIAGTSFTIQSSQGTDGSTVAYLMIEPA